MNNRKKLAIIDGKSVFYRGYYALPNLSTHDGTPTGGVYGFAAMALELLKKLQPDYVCVAWDKPKTNIRRRLELYPEYKAGRKPPPPDFYVQIPILHELLEAFNWPLYELDDYEADDIMGSFAKQAEVLGVETMLITSDLDMLQCISELTSVYVLKKGFSQIERYDPSEFEQKYGIEVGQFVDMKAIMGDSSDNIPGVPGIGAKGAAALLQQYKTLDGIYDNVELISGGAHTKLMAGRELAYLSHKLAEIWTNAPLHLDLAAMEVANCEPKKVKDILAKLEFRSLVRQLPESMSMAGLDVLQNASVQLDLPKVIVISTIEGSQELDFSVAKKLLIYSRCRGKHGKDPTHIVVSTSEKVAYVLDVVALGPSQVKSILAKVVADNTVPKIGYDIKNTIKALYTVGCKLQNVGHDVLIAAFLINSVRREQTLSELAFAELGYEGNALEDLDDEQFITLAPEVIGVMWALQKAQYAALEAMPKVAELAKNIEWPVIPVLAEMEYEGIELDTEYLSEFNEQLIDSVSDIEQQIYGHADQEFNISSPAQLADVLFVNMSLSTAGIKKGKTGYSTAATELFKLKALHPIIDLITQYREITKLKNTYVDALPKMADSKSRVHTTFNLTIAQTGRLSSTDPNLQNIPVRTDLGKHIRTAFVAGRGKALVSADYSQFELRLAAVLAGDSELIAMFNRGVDVHTATAAQLYDRELEDVTKNMRREAKTINFGILYGMSPHGLSVATGMTIIAAKKFIDKYFELRRPLLDYMNGLKELARAQGYVETLFGRRRPVPDIYSSNFLVRAAAERAATNMPIQGTEADLMKIAMVAVNKLLPTGAKQLLQIHDSILVECDESQAVSVADLLKSTMESVYKLPVELIVDTSVGQNWGEL